jgi:hypothetical protein
MTRADAILEEGLTLDTIRLPTLAEIDIELARRAWLKYSDDQPRDDQGQWTDGGGGAGDGGDRPAAALYHGTADEKLDSIIANGLQAKYAGTNWPDLSRQGSIYVADSFDAAREWAILVSEQGNDPGAVAAVLEIHVPKDMRAFLVRDENPGGGLGAWRYKGGDIPPSWIRRVDKLTTRPGQRPGIKPGWTRVRGFEDDRVIYFAVLLRRGESDAKALDRVETKYSDDQPRDEQGRWADGGGSGVGGNGRSDDQRADVMDVVDDDADADYSAQHEASQPWHRSLSRKEAAALRLYTDRGGFRAINDYLRGGTSSPQTRDAARALEGALDRSVVPDGERLYRGLHLVGREEAARFAESVPPGSVFHDNGFFSVSPSSAIAGSFAVPASDEDTGVFFRLTARGAKGAYVAARGKEPEYVLQRGAKVVVRAIDRRLSGLLVVDGEVGH